MTSILMAKERERKWWRKGERVTHTYVVRTVQNEGRKDDAKSNISVPISTLWTAFHVRNDTCTSLSVCFEVIGTLKVQDFDFSYLPRYT